MNDHSWINEWWTGMMVQGDTSPGEPGLGCLRFWPFNPLPGSAWADRKLAELAEQPRQNGGTVNQTQVRQEMCHSVSHLLLLGTVRWSAPPIRRTSGSWRPTTPPSAPWSRPGERRRENWQLISVIYFIRENIIMQPEGGIISLIPRAGVQ